MRRASGPFMMSNKIQELLTKKELALVGQSESPRLKAHTPHKLKQYLKLARALRQKYRDLTQRQKSRYRNTESFRTIEKAKFFDRLTQVYEKQAEQNGVGTPTRKGTALKNQKPADMDGLSEMNGKSPRPRFVKIGKDVKNVVVQDPDEIQ